MPASFVRAKLLIALTLGAVAACSGEEPAKVDLTLDGVDASEPVTTDPRFGNGDGEPRRGNDTGLRSDISVPDTAPDALGDATLADDGAAQPETIAKMTSCAGVCGLFLEDNDCHCGPSCIKDGNCCSDYASVCKCATPKDCDDGNGCTDDKCEKGYCKQIPIPASNCCNSDGDCKGGDKCNAAKCITGTCVVTPKECKDTVACTKDGCDLATGDCTHIIQTGMCLVDGQCSSDGNLKPGSAGCATCQSKTDNKAWTPKAGHCFVDGACVADKKPSPTASCAMCDVSQVTDKWTVAAGKCLIDDKCYAAGDKNPADDCMLCDPTVSATVWSPKANACAIDGKCYAGGAKKPDSECLVCAPSKAKTAWSAQAGYCSIDDKCVKSGAGDPCKTCDPAKSTTAWTIKPAGTSCAVAACQKDAKCTAEGECKGTAVANCCTKDEDCANMSPTPGACETAACNKGTGKCEVKPDPTCCSAGVCCDVATKTLKEKGTPCSTFKLGTEYQCNGQAVEKRDILPGCTGTEATKCSQGSPGYGPWTATGKVCSDTEVCTPNATSPQTSPVCKTK